MSVVMRRQGHCILSAVCSGEAMSTPMVLEQVRTHCRTRRNSVMARMAPRAAGRS
ncbi:hypothetical protein BV25DRAFT_1826695 [Artomyces pyxidatus]|uniref:Uncharacterized protein n=1 Tax=Artomyces pyxidatus TaxID=48021 RepID=A0ACB8SY70_9AGAM|nr:hypothetical protein BV25DRAFT_1826695 [Artomyces pyxidatus]